MQSSFCITFFLKVTQKVVLDYVREALFYYMTAFAVSRTCSSLHKLKIKQFIIILTNVVGGLERWKILLARSDI